MSAPPFDYPCPGCDRVYTAPTRIAISGPRIDDNGDRWRAIWHMNRRPHERPNMLVYCFNCWHRVGTPAVIDADQAVPR